jgi:phage terminase large subunit-like protein
VAPDYAKVLHDYAKWAARKRNKQVGRWVRLAAQRHLRDWKRSRRRNLPRWDYYFEKAEVNRVCGFVEELPHVEGEWDTPTLTLEPWQVFLLGVVFGWRRYSDDKRRFNTAYVELARKNGKSFLSSAVALYCLCCEDEPGPQVKTAATTGDQARIVFDVAKKVVSHHTMGEFRAYFGLEGMANAVTCSASGGSIRPINAKASTQDGLNPHLAIIDELHAHKDRALFDVLKSARGARKNPLSWYITTAGYNVEGVCYEQRRLVTQILEGVVPGMDHYFGIIWTLDKGDDEFDPKVWPKANPNFGVSVSPEEFAGYADEARLSPDSHAEFRTKRCNIWTSARDGWVNIDLWRRNTGEVDLDELEDVPAFLAADLASTTDMASVRLVWLVGDRVKTWGRYYLPEEAVEPRTMRGNVPYQRWAAEGRVIPTPGGVIDYAYIERDIKALCERFNVRELIFDPWNAKDLIQRLQEAGFPVIEFPQSVARFNSPMKELERRYRVGLLDHGNDPVLTWNASNLVSWTDPNGNVKPDKKRSPEKIDGMVTLIMALDRALELQPGPSVYEARGLRSI